MTGSICTVFVNSRLAHAMRPDMNRARARASRMDAFSGSISRARERYMAA